MVRVCSGCVVFWSGDEERRVCGTVGVSRSGGGRGVEPYRYFYTYTYSTRHTLTFVHAFVLPAAPGLLVLLATVLTTCVP